ncbi:hypothetical protein, partial [Elioraea sp.]|uniref:hypothetical protein n=1 Tax=Elioraea sp. TaxID=2185103 RepID=UPI00307DA644
MLEPLLMALGPWRSPLLVFAVALGAALAARARPALAGVAAGVGLAAGLFDVVGAMLITPRLLPERLPWLALGAALIGAALDLAPLGRRLRGAVLVAGAGAAALAARGGWQRAAAGVVALLMLASNVAGTVAFARQPRLDAFDWRLVARTLAAQAADGDAIVLLPGFSRIPLDYYYGGPQPRLALVPDGRDAIADDGGRLPEVTRRLVAHRRVWVLTAPPVPPAVEA